MKKLIFILFLGIAIGTYGQTTFYTNAPNASVSTAGGLRVTLNSYTETLQTLIAHASQYFFWSTDDGVPGLSTFTPGTVTVYFSAFTDATSTLTAKVRVHRVNSAGVIQQSTAYTSSQYLNAFSVSKLTFSVTPSWTSGGYDDRFVVEIAIQNATDSNRVLVWRYGGNETYVNTPFTGIATSRRVFIIN